jgi:16S rRNA (guanine527-N7)-methyltransferase
MESSESVSGRLTIVLDGQQTAQMDSYASLLIDANAAAGLMSSGTDRNDLYQRHFPEALRVLAVLESEGLPLSPAIDIGSGGGLPGIPLAIARPQLVLTLLESTAKKAAFLERAVSELGLANVTVVQGRAEELGRDPDHRGHYRLATARAVAPLPVLVELALPFLVAGGVLAAVKGSRHLQEIAAASGALSQLGGVITGTFPLGVVGGALVVIRKDAETPERYPRRTARQTRASTFTLGRRVPRLRASC